MRRNYAQSSRGAATRQRAGAGRRTHTESYGSAGRGSRGGGRRMPQQGKKSNNGVMVGVLIGCAVIVLVAIVFAMSGGSGDNNLEDKLQESPEKEVKNDNANADVVAGKKTNVPDNPKISNPDKKDTEEEDFDDDDDWTTKDPDAKKIKLGNRDQFNK